MLEPLRILLPTLTALLHERHDLLVENLLLRHQLQVGAPLSPAAALQDQRSILLAVRSLARPGLEAAPCPRPTGDRTPLAPPGLAPLLALALRPSPGPASVESRDP
ncbi:MAG: hypothetical protein ACR2MZ_01315 [Candidatus Dormibacter sp.]|uniref:hypothetical protein n=1 Tax=Candidatus Dormibacter sp. TaxID=2973982 RepID=UPI000DAF92B6|nr:MAG: hypothetical protein DLM66_09945 [Candidatus Dormibacteraeota bacterium]